MRQPRSAFPVGTGQRRAGKRLLTVGTDCAVGKKYTALAIEHELRRRGVPCDFRATGQTGLLISGRGIVIDAVVADFIAGAAEVLSPANRPDHWDVVEGQGTLFHPSYAGVTLGLIHGTQPDALVVCHDPQRRHLDEMPDFPVPDVAECALRHVQAAQLTNPQARCVGVSVNTSRMPDEVGRGVPAGDRDPHGRALCRSDARRRRGHRRSSAHQFQSKNRIAQPRPSRHDASYPGCVARRAVLSFRITGLDPKPFQHLFGRPVEELRKHRRCPVSRGREARLSRPDRGSRRRARRVRASSQLHASACGQPVPRKSCHLRARGRERSVRPDRRGSRRDANPADIAAGLRRRRSHDRRGGGRRARDRACHRAFPEPTLASHTRTRITPDAAVTPLASTVREPGTGRAAP